ncbi:FAD-binding oxidoreductase [Clostridium paridis]|uniref:Ferric reductase-like transmembrane domain-containing protein n=1 Tax=Clostridium paridis TaxID=2803863 RepID=A0A937FG23_9CLOT|nr:ferric reductase-like transmembrane domain-containing protein [Clostridium paridis]MBL4933144.1 ferric reductase-like transmembrane domain-containing protein [Clostridium paridis]
MKKYFGIIIILITFILTYIFWYLEESGNSSISFRGYSQLLASIAMVTLAWINYISTRHSLIDKLFNGLDKSYIYHKYLSILTIILIWAHDLTLKVRNFPGGEGPSEFKGMKGIKPPEGFSKEGGSSFLGFHLSGKELGSLSLYIFTAFVIFFLITYKLEYQKWKVLHALMLIPYVFGTIHYYLDSEYPTFSLSAYSIWMNLINVIGILSALYSIFLYEFTAFKYKYNVISIKEIAKNTIEITGSSSGKYMHYKPGQFAFLKVQGNGKGFPSHPFSMSSYEKAGEVKFAIKVLGDHTDRLKNTLKTGDIIALAGPHGLFNYTLGLKNQIWIAGGIGVTPFRSFWQSDIPENYEIDFFFAYNNEQDAPYVHELKSMRPLDNLHIHLFDSSKTGFLETKDFEEFLSKDKEYDVFFCGPKGMRLKASKDLEKGMFKVKDFHFEYFQFK